MFHFIVIAFLLQFFYQVIDQQKDGYNDLRVDLGISVKVKWFIEGEVNLLMEVKKNVDCRRQFYNCNKLINFEIKSMRFSHLNSNSYYENISHLKS